MSLPAGNTTRPATMNDLEAIYDLYLACSLAEHGSPDFSRAELLSWWRDEDFDLPTDSWIVLSPAGVVAGYADVSHDPSGGLNFGGRVHPDHTGSGIGGYLVAWAERHAATLVASMPEVTGVTLHQWVPVVNGPARELLRSAGFAPARRFWRMRIDIEEPPTAPAWPSGVAPRVFVRGQDEAATHQAVQDAFYDHWRHDFVPLDRWVRREIEREDFDASFWFLATEGGEIVGVAHCRMDGEMGWIDELGVRPGWRRRGVARALLQTVVTAFYNRGVHSVGLGVDAQSETGAPQLYEEAGMRVYRQWDIYEKPFGSARA